MKNIAIALNAGTPATRNAITMHFSVTKRAYWHWIDDFWIVQVPDTYTTQALHNELEALPSVGQTATILLFEFKGRISYWGRAPKEAWEWLKHIGESG